MKTFFRSSVLVLVSVSVTSASADLKKDLKAGAKAVLKQT